MFHWLGWCKFIAAIVICAPIACSDQLLPQLIAYVASLDRDHSVSLHANGEGIDLLLTHDHQPLPINDDGLGLKSASEPAHVIHIMTGSTFAKQPPLLVVSKTPDVALYFSTTVASLWWTFVPPQPLAYSRPPPDEISILPFDSSTLLLI